jgi:ribosomal protein L7/L12
MEKEWKLNKDLYEDDNILDPITFYDIILMLDCNEKVIDKTTALKCYKELLEMRLEDAKDLININLDEIVKEAKKRRK